MEKLKRYLGLAAAALLLMPIFIKLDSGRAVGSVERFYGTPTPLGINLPTVAAFALHPARRFWVPATEYLELLDGRRDSFGQPLCLSGADHGVRDFVANHQSEFDAYEPGLAELLGSYCATNESRDSLLRERTQAAKAWEEMSNLAREEKSLLAVKQAMHVANEAELAAHFQAKQDAAARKRSEVEQRWAKAERAWTEAQRAADLFLGVHAPSKEQRANDLVWANLHTGPNVFAAAYNSRLGELQSRIAPALKGYLLAKKLALDSLILAAHLLLLLSVFLVVRKRDRVGAAILWPVTALVGAGKEGALAAKRLHEKV